MKKCTVFIVAGSVVYNNGFKFHQRLLHHVKASKKSKHCFKVDNRIRLLSIESNCGTQHPDSFLNPDLSSKMLNAILYDMLIVSIFVALSFGDQQESCHDLFNDFLGNYVFRAALFFENRFMTMFKFIEPVSRGYHRWWRVSINSIQIGFYFFTHFSLKKNKKRIMHRYYSTHCIEKYQTFLALMAVKVKVTYGFI